ncbi:MAG: protein kinase [Bryobacteraceae bacterium]
MTDSPTLPSSPLGVPDEFQGTSRFVVQERLGAGTFGIVYRVLDRERNSMVALKLLRHLDADRLLRFKHEFRSLVDVVHPNLVQLYELFGEDRHWFFTMELVEGTDFLSYLRPGNVLSGWDRIRDAFCQLANGVQALHSSAQVHRDLKPSNVLVTNSGRVLILDFGLVKELAPQSIEQTFSFAGSPVYMAPEQAVGGPVTVAADWYAVGVMLYRTITGRFPFHGPELFARKQAEDPPFPGDLVPDVPVDLNETCHLLLARTPEPRMIGAMILREPRPTPGTAPQTGQDGFVGRSAELSLLHHRLEALSSGKLQVVLAYGGSGIGKSSLIARFLTGVRRECPNAVILKGRCHESESVPYKALDSVADELVRHLQSLPESISGALLPRRPALLKRLFPVFGELEILSAFPEGSTADLEEHETRRQAFAALLEMLGRMSDRNTIVIAIDDLQWADLDSVAFLEELVLSPVAPALMLVLAFRSENLNSSPPLQLLRDFKQHLKSPECWTEMELRGLSEEEGRDLLRNLADAGRKIGPDQVSAVLAESEGSPLFLRELLRFALNEPETAEQRDAPTRLRISDVIRRRADAISPTGRRLLEGLAVAGEPLSKLALRSAVNAPDEELSREIWLLIHENLVRIAGEAGKLEPFHDQVREAALSWLSPSALRDWHARLAQALQAEHNPDPQRLFRHHLGAGNVAAAFQSALAAARMAENALAFDRAARFYTETLQTGEGDAAAHAMLHRKRAEALSKAGRGRESGASYLEAAKFPAYNDSLEMRRLAAEQLMRSGYLDEGIQIYRDLLPGTGVHLPDQPLACLLRGLTLRAFTKVRGMRWRPRTEAQLPAQRLRKLDLLWNGALVLTTVDPIFANYLQARHMLEALRAGEPSRLALSAGLGVFFESLAGQSEYLKGRKLLEFAESVSGNLNDPYVTAITRGAWATLDFLCGRIQSGLEHSQKAVAGLAEIAIGVSWETATFNALFVWFLGWGGRIRQLSETIAPILDDARSRGDVYQDIIARCFMTAHLVGLAADSPDRVIEETARALSQWRKSRYDLQHFAAAFAIVECHLYAGRPDLARRLVLSEWQAIEGSLIFRKAQAIRITLFYMRGRTALAVWLKERTDRRLRREVEHYASKLLNIGSPWGQSMGRMLRAGLLVGRSRVAEALLLLEQAEDSLREQDLQLLAAAVSRRRGELEKNAGSAKITADDEFMRSENILRPDRMTAMILPGDWF